MHRKSFGQERGKTRPGSVVWAEPSLARGPMEVTEDPRAACLLCREQVDLYKGIVWKKCTWSSLLSLFPLLPAQLLACGEQGQQQAAPGQSHGGKVFWELSFFRLVATGGELGGICCYWVEFHPIFLPMSRGQKNADFGGKMCDQFSPTASNELCCSMRLWFPEYLALYDTLPASAAFCAGRVRQAVWGASPLSPPPSFWHPSP